MKTTMRRSPMALALIVGLAGLMGTEINRIPPVPKKDPEPEPEDRAKRDRDFMAGFEPGR
jgi:hypothetical protein